MLRTLCVTLLLVTAIHRCTGQTQRTPDTSHTSVQALKMTVGMHCDGLPLAETIRCLLAGTGVQYRFDARAMGLGAPVTLNVEDESLGSVLAHALSQAPFPLRARPDGDVLIISTDATSSRAAVGPPTTGETHEVLAPGELRKPHDDARQVSMHVRNLPLDTVIETISRAGGVPVRFDHEAVATVKPEELPDVVSVDFDELPMDVALRRVLRSRTGNALYNLHLVNGVYVCSPLGKAAAKPIRETVTVPHFPGAGAPPVKSSNAPNFVVAQAGPNPTASLPHTAPVSLDLVNADFDTAMQKLLERTGLDYAYAASAAPGRVTLSLRDADLTDALYIVLSQDWGATGSLRPMLLDGTLIIAADWQRRSDVATAPRNVSYRFQHADLFGTLEAMLAVSVPSYSVPPDAKGKSVTVSATNVPFDVGLKRLLAEQPGWGWMMTNDIYSIVPGRSQ